MIPQDVTNAGPQAVAIYEKSITSGDSPRLAEMLALRTVPAARTTDDYFRGRNSLQQQYGEAGAERVAANLAKHGYRVKPGDCYNPTAARFPGDPMAVESRLNGGRDHVRRIHRNRVEELDRQNEREAKHGPPPAEDIVLRRAKQLVKADGHFQKKRDKRELREAAIASLKD